MGSMHGRLGPDRPMATLSVTALKDRLRAAGITDLDDVGKPELVELVKVYGHLNLGQILRRCNFLWRC